MVDARKQFLGLSTDEKVINYIYNVGNRISNVKEELRAETLKLFPDDYVMCTERSEGELLKKLVQISKAKRGIEIGVFTGYSGLCLAEGLPEDGKLIALDISEEFTSLAKKYWEKAGVDKKIELIIKPALESLDELIKKGEKFDFAYVDADKINYINYFEKLLLLINKGGFIVFDNTLWNGRVCNDNIKEEEDLLTFTLNKLNHLLHENQRIEINLVPISDGMTISYIL